MSKFALPLRVTISQKQKYEGETVPTGYGIAYWENHRFMAIYYPVPINFLIAWARWLYFGVSYNWIPITKRTKMLAESFENGRSAGFAEGKRIGWSAGRKQTLDELSAHLKARFHAN